MRKHLIFILLILFSCEKDEIPPEVIEQEYNFVFDNSNTSISDGEIIHFNLTTEGQSQLILSLDSSVVTKENFIGSIGLNTKQVFTKTLPKQKLTLSLIDANGETTVTYVTIE